MEDSPTASFKTVDGVEALDAEAGLPEFSIPAFVLEGPPRMGGFGLLYRAREEIDGGPVIAVKVLFPSPFLLSEEAGPRFLREVAALRKLKHPAIVRYLLAGFTKDQHKAPYVAMEYVEGASLRDLAPELSTQEKVRAVLAVLEALEHAHENGIYHRDIKPSNIMRRSTDGQFILVDFGMAFLADGAGSADLTKHLLGTPGYIPRESVNSPAKSRSPKFDIFATGVTLYELLTGRLPADDGTHPRLEPMKADFAGLDPILERALAAENHRYGTADDFASDLRCWLETGKAAWPAMNPRTEDDPLVQQVIKMLAFCEGFPTFLTVMDQRGLSPTGHGLPNYPFEVPSFRDDDETLASLATQVSDLYVRFSQAQGHLGTLETRLAAWRQLDLSIRRALVGVLTTRHGEHDGLVVFHAAAGAARQLSVRVLAEHPGWLELTDLLGQADAGKRPARRRRTTLRRVLVGHKNFVWDVALTPDGRRVLSASNDRTVRMWDVSTGLTLATFSGHAAHVCSIGLTREGRTLASGAADGGMKIWDMITRTHLADLYHGALDAKVAWAPGSDRLSSGGADGRVRIWGWPSMECVRTIDAHTKPILKLAFLDDGEHVLSVSADKTAQICSVATGECVRTFEGHTGEVNSAAISQDGTRMVTASEDRTWSYPGFVDT